MTRKEFLQILAAGGASFLGLPQPVIAQLSEDEKRRGSPVNWARLKFVCDGNDVDDWNVHPHGDMNLIDATQEQTSINLHKQWCVASIDDVAEMAPYPFLFMHADQAPMLEDSQRKNLAEYLKRGGFLFAEDCVNGKHNRGGVSDRFFMRMIEELPKIVPEAKIEQVPFDHPIFHTMYHFDDGLPHMQGQPHGLYGATLNDRLIAVLSPSDLHCGWTNGNQWFGSGKAEIALKMGINIYAFAMTQG